MGEGAVTISMKLSVEKQTVLLVITFHTDCKILSFILAKNRSRGKLHASLDTWRTCTQQTGSMQNSNLQPTVCLKSLIFNALCVCVCVCVLHILQVSPKHVFHPFLLFSPKLEFYKVIFLTAGDHNLTVHKGRVTNKMKATDQ